MTYDGLVLNKSRDGVIRIQHSDQRAALIEQATRAKERGTEEKYIVKSKWVSRLGYSRSWPIIKRRGVGRGTLD